jgi:alpha-tubulin suppressor-like RCC1 family protein
MADNTSSEVSPIAEPGPIADSDSTATAAAVGASTPTGDVVNVDTTTTAAAAATTAENSSVEAPEETDSDVTHSSVAAPTVTPTPQESSADNVQDDIKTADADSTITVPQPPSQATNDFAGSPRTRRLKTSPAAVADTTNPDASDAEKPPALKRPATHRGASRAESKAASRRIVPQKSRDDSVIKSHSKYSRKAKTSQSLGTVLAQQAAAAQRLPMRGLSDAAIVDHGPSPDLKKRCLIFDSLRKIVDRKSGRTANGNNLGRENRGTYIYTFGAGYHGQLGRKFARGSKKYATMPQLVEMNVPVREVACGGLHSAAVSDNGAVYSWGDGRADQLGHLHEGFSNQQDPRVVDSLEGLSFVTHIACGQSHSVALTERGTLFCWGFAKFGQLGTGERSNVKVPRRLPPIDEDGQRLPRFIDVIAGDNHTVAIADNGSVYSFGSGEHGQLGHDTQADQLRPRRIEALADVKIVSADCGSTHSAFVSAAGDVYVCGFGENFYPKQDQNFYYTPIKIPFKETVTQVACGQSHIMVLTNKGDVYAWGSGSFGQLGHGAVGSLPSPRLVLHGKAISQIDAGRYHSVALTNFGAVYTWGCGENGQLGHGSDDNVLIPRLVDAHLGNVVGQVCCGEHHTAILASSPWHKLPQDMADWVFLEHIEYQLKFKHLRSTMQGLFKKDLVRIREQMEQVRSELYYQRDVIKTEEEQQWKVKASHVRRHSQLIEEIVLEQQQSVDDAVMRSKVLDHRLSCAWANTSSLDLGDSKTEQASYISEDDAASIKAESDVGTPLSDVEDASEWNVSSFATADTRANADADTDTVDNSLPAEKLINDNETHHARQQPDTVTGNWMLTGVDLEEARQKKSFHLDMPATTSIGDNKRMEKKLSLHLSSILSPRISQGMSATSARDFPPMFDNERLPRLAQTERGIYEDPSQRSGKNSSLQYYGRGTSAGRSDESSNEEPAKLSARAQYFRDSQAMIKKFTSLVAKNSKGDGNVTAYLKRQRERVYALRREYDLLCDAVQQREIDMKKTDRRRIVVCGATPEQQVQLKRFSKQLNTLEMKLDTVTIKINETDQNRKNYELNIAHLKEEEFEWYLETESLRTQVAESEKILKKMNQEKVHAIQKRDKAELEVEEFKKEIANQNRFLEQQFEKYSIVAASQRSRNQRRHRIQKDRNAKQKQRIMQRISKLQEEAEQSTAEAEKLHAELNDVTDQLAYYERRFQQITSATGLREPEAIINKFHLKEEIRKQLEDELQAKKVIIFRMASFRDQMSSRLASIKDDSIESKWRDVDHLEDQCRAAQAQEEAARVEYDKNRQTLAYVREGLLSLLAASDVAAAGADDDEDVDPCDVVAVTTQLFQRLVKLQTTVEEFKANNPEFASPPKQTMSARSSESAKLIGARSNAVASFFQNPLEAIRHQMELDEAAAVAAATATATVESDQGIIAVDTDTDPSQGVLPAPAPAPAAAVAGV